MSTFTNHTDKVRSKMVALFSKELDDIALCRRIERSIYNYCILLSEKKRIKKKWTDTIFKNLYESKIRSIYSNIKSDSYIQNKEFKKRIIDGEIDVNKIADLSAYDIYPDVWKELIDMKTKSDKLKYELRPEAMTDVFKCRRCNSRSCSYYEVQTRSADEPMTQFINCLDCGNRWRQ